mmetsp:Transcript_96581/g.270356  ORF Transcript_96581/g.270356 Transcript_96581/m.270356 type:complete len:317 (-) Transcript_96581:239-1189(-)
MPRGPLRGARRWRADPRVLQGGRAASARGGAPRGHRGVAPPQELAARLRRAHGRLGRGLLPPRRPRRISPQAGGRDADPVAAPRRQVRRRALPQLADVGQPRPRRVRRLHRHAGDELHARGGRLLPGTRERPEAAHPAEGVRLVVQGRGFGPLGAPVVGPGRLAQGAHRALGPAAPLAAAACAHVHGAALAEQPGAAEAAQLHGEGAGLHGGDRRRPGPRACKPARAVAAAALGCGAGRAAWPRRRGRPRLGGAGAPNWREVVGGGVRDPGRVGQGGRGGEQQDRGRKLQDPDLAQRAERCDAGDRGAQQRGAATI